MKLLKLAMIVCLLSACTAPLTNARLNAQGVCQVTPEAPMMPGLNGFFNKPLFTISESIGGYTPTGIPDGIGAFEINRRTIRLLVSSELGSTAGYEYELLSGAKLKGARVSYFDLDKRTLSICGAGLAYHTAYDRNGLPVIDAAQVGGGFGRFCSSRSVQAGEYGFVDNIYFCGEESGPLGSEWAIDVDNGVIWAAPALGRGSWENVAPIKTRNRNTVALILSDDTAPRPMYLYVGTKNAIGDGSFLDRNGLASGQLYAWVANDASVIDPTGFNGSGSEQQGAFMPIPNLDPTNAGDLDGNQLATIAFGMGAFAFSRPEDVHENPNNPSEFVMASTGRSQLFGGVDSWGTIYKFSVLDEISSRRVRPIEADVEIIYDCDDLQDFGIRSPDNVVWTESGYIYVQEDSSVSAFGTISGEEASMWKLNPNKRFRPNRPNFVRIAQMDRTAIAPVGSEVSGAGIVGYWESSGVLDLSPMFKLKRGETLLIADVQAHGLSGGLIGGNANLVEGGQLFLLYSGFDDDDDHGHGDHDDDDDDRGRGHDDDD